MIDIDMAVGLLADRVVVERMGKAQLHFRVHSLLLRLRQIAGLFLDRFPGLYRLSFFLNKSAVQGLGA